MRTSKYSFNTLSGVPRQSSLTLRDWPPYLVSDVNPAYFDGITFTGVYEDVTTCALNHYETKVSFSTPGWNSFEKVKGVMYKQKHKKSARIFPEPTAPVFRPPSFLLPPIPVLSLPFKKARNEHERKANANAVRKFGKRKKFRSLMVTKRNRILELYNTAFKQKVAKYKILYAQYLDYRRKLKNPRTKRGALTVRPFPPPMNPFKKIILHNMNHGGDGSWLVWDSIGGLTPHVLNMSRGPVHPSSMSSVPPDINGVYTIDKAKADDMADSMVAAMRNLMKDEILDLDAKLIRKFYDKLSNQKVHIGNIIAERAQTLDLLRSSILALKKLVGIKKGVIKSIVKASLDPKLLTKKLSNNYLAYQFGVQPLISDIYASVEILNNPGLGADIIAIRTNSTKFVSINKDGQHINGRLNRSYVYYFGVTSDVSRSLNSLGIFNPAEIAWEVLPWSFVFDWILPIGAYISSLTSLAGVEFISGVVTEKFQGIQISTPSSAAPSIMDGSQHYQGFGEFAVSYTIREVAFAPPDAYTMLKLKSPISWTHGLESLALIVQKLARSFK